MEKIKITFLGTGNAVPTKKRNHTAIFLAHKNEGILIDCGEGTQRQFKVAKISPSKITKILITHWHGDHILGLPGLFQTLAMNDYKKTLEIYGPKGTEHYIELLRKLVNIEINLKVHELYDNSLDFKEYLITSAPMFHGTPTLAYSFQIKDQNRLLKEKIKKFNLPNTPLLKELKEGRDIEFNGKKIRSSQVSKKERGKKITFILDTGMNERAIKIAEKSDLLVCESSFSEKEQTQAKEYKHLTSFDAATIAKKSKSTKLILTHLSQRHEHNPKQIESEAKKIFKKTSLAKDFDKIEV